MPAPLSSSLVPKLPQSVRAVLATNSDLRKRIDHQRSKHAEKVQQLKAVGHRAVRTATIATSAAALGYATGRNGVTRVGPAPLELVLAALAYGSAATGTLGRFTELAVAAGDGAVASFAHQWGRGLGREARARGGLAPLAPASMGAMPLPDATGGSALSTP